jgi:hypothetical protein
MPAIVPSIDRREQGRLFGTVVADAFDDHEERQAGDQQGNAAMGAPGSGCGRGQRTGGRAPSFEVVRVQAASRLGQRQVKRERIYRRTVALLSAPMVVGRPWVSSRDGTGTVGSSSSAASAATRCQP